MTSCTHREGCGHADYYWGEARVDEEVLTGLVGLVMLTVGG